MSGFLDEVAAEVRHPGTKMCTVAVVLDDADPDVRDGLITTVRDPKRYSAAAIERALKKRGVKLPQTVIQRHRRGDCTCPAELRPPTGDD